MYTLVLRVCAIFLFTFCYTAHAAAGAPPDTTQSSTYSALAEKYLTKNADTAKFFAKKALKIAQKNENFEETACALINMGMADYIRGSYFESLETASRLMDISLPQNYKPGIGNAHHIRGLIYLAQDEFDDAIFEFEKALIIFRRLKNQSKQVKILFNLGVCYDEKHQSEKAFDYLNQTIKLANTLHDEHMIAMAHNRKGETFYHMGKYADAITYHEKVLAGPYRETWEDAFAYSGLAQAQLQLNHYTDALKNSLLSLKLSQQVNSLWDEVRALRIVSKTYAGMGNYKQAYYYQTVYNQKNDSLLNDDKQNKLSNLHLQQQRLDNLSLEKANQLHMQKIKFNRVVIAGIGLLALCIAILAIAISRNNVHKTALNNKLARQNRAIVRQKDEISLQNQKLDQLNRTKNQLFSVVSHDLRGPFASIIQTFELFKDGDLTYDEKETIFNHFQQQISHVNIMVNNLLIWANSQLSGTQKHAKNIDCVAVINEVLPVYTNLAENKSITLKHLANGPREVYADLDHLRIIIQNILGNAIKFTLRGGQISIFYADDDEYQIIHIKDNGVGIPAEKMAQLFKVIGKDISNLGTQNEAGAGIGLMLIKQFVEMNNGQLKIFSAPGAGTDVVIYLPKAKLH